MKRNILKALLGLGLISLSSIFPVRASAQVKPVAEQTLEEKAGINITVNAEKTIGSENNFSSNVSQNIISNYNNIFYSNYKTDAEIQNIIDNVGSMSYDSFLSSISSLNVNQKLSLLSAISDSLYNHDYNLDLIYNPVLSQEEFFKDFQNSLEGISRDLGVCRQISVHIERLANDLGLRAAAVNGLSSNGIGHAYDVIKTENGIAIVNGYQILYTNTNNVEDVLSLYQKMKGYTVLQHLFFEDSKFKYQLITKTGKDYLDFIGYDESLRTLEHALFEHGSSSNQKIAISLYSKDYLKSIEANLLGFFLKYGEITSASDSEFKMNLSEAGYKREFLIPGIIQINPNVSILSGTLKNKTSYPVLGYNCSLFASTDFEKLNLSLGAKTTDLERDWRVFADSSLDAGASYKMNLKNLNITPYILSRFVFAPSFDEIRIYTPELGEISAGSKFEFSSENLGLSVNPHYSMRMWEQELGADVKFNYKNLGIKFGGYLTKSSYDFCPDKRGLEIETSASSDNLGVTVKYKDDLTDYSGETKTDSIFSINGQIKL